MSFVRTMLCGLFILSAGFLFNGCSTLFLEDPHEYFEVTIDDELYVLEYGPEDEGLMLTGEPAAFLSPEKPGEDGLIGATSEPIDMDRIIVVFDLTEAGEYEKIVPGTYAFLLVEEDMLSPGTYDEGILFIAHSTEEKTEVYISDDTEEYQHMSITITETGDILEAAKGTFTAQGVGLIADNGEEEIDNVSISGEFTVIRKE